MRTHSSRGFHTLIVTGLLGSIVLGSFLYLGSMNLMGSRSRVRRADPAPVTNLAAVVMLRRCNLSPEFLAAAGVSAQEAAGIRSRVADAMTSREGELSSADSALASARATLGNLDQQLRATGSVDTQALAAAKAAVTSAVASRQAALDRIRSDALGEEFSPSKGALLARLAANNSWNLPTQYLVVDRSQAQWVSLRDALASVRIAGQAGQTPSAVASELVQAADADPAVSAAANNLSTLLGPIVSSIGSP